MRQKKRRPSRAKGEDHEKLLEQVRARLAKQPAKYGLPPITQTFKERPIREVVEKLDISPGVIPKALFKQVGDMKPDLVLTHAEDDSITIVEVTTVKPAGTMKSGNLLQTKIREDSEKLRRMKEFFDDTGKFTDCRIIIAYRGGGGRLIIGPPPEEPTQ